MLRGGAAPSGCFLVALLFHAGSEISTRLRSGSRTYTERSFDTAPVLETGTSIMGMPAFLSFSMTSWSGTPAMKQRSSDTGTATCARGVNSLTHSCRLMLWVPDLCERRYWGGLRR